MSEQAWKYGDVIRVDPTTQPQVPQPDDRRWMVVACTPYGQHRWTLLYCGPDIMGRGAIWITHWPAMYGFCRVEEPE